AQAAVWFTYQSPKVGQGPYAKVDVGAGTTNVSIFRLYGELPARTKELLKVFATYSSVSGMDTLDSSIARSRGTPDALAFRGRENVELDNAVIANGCSHAIEQIYAAFAEAWRRSLRKFQGLPHEMDRWHDECRLFVIGGGSLVRAVQERLRKHPADQNRLLDI